MLHPPHPPLCCKYLHRVSLDGGRATPYLTIFPKAAKDPAYYSPAWWVNSKLGIPSLPDLESLLLPSCNKSECNHPRTKLRVCLFRVSIVPREILPCLHSFRVEHCTENRNCFFVIVLTQDSNDARQCWKHNEEFVITRSLDENSIVSSVSVPDLFVTRPKKVVQRDKNLWLSK